MFVNLGRHPNIHRQGKASMEKMPEVDEFVQRIREARREVEEALRKTNEVMKRKADTRREGVIEYKEGDLV